MWNTLCSQRGDCPGPDFDYGSSLIFEKLSNGRDILLAGQKSGVVYDLDPDRKGEILWQVRVGQGQLEYGRIVSQLARERYERALAVDIRDTPEPGYQMEPEVRKLKYLLESMV